jgi:hypothetical protein
MTVRRTGIDGSLTHLVWTVLLTGLLTSTGCYHFRVTSKSDSDVLIHSETRHQLLWGLVGSGIELSADSKDPARRCDSNSLQEVSVSTNFGFALITVLTLGIWSPATVHWTCAAVPPEEGSLPAPPIAASK